MKKIFWSIILIVIVSFFVSKADFVLAQDISLKSNQIYLFYSSTCPHCAKEKEFLKELEKKYPEIEVKKYEVMTSPENQKLLKEFYKKYDVPEREQGMVPATFTSSDYFIGFNEQVAREIENCLKECLTGEGEVLTKEIKIPLIGKVDISKMSLPVLTAVLGALDGFNPCAMWILMFLIAFLINTRSRKKIWLVGGTFITASGLFYFLLLAAWLNLFLAISYVNITRLFIGIFAIGFGVWQLKEFVYYQPGVCKVLGLKPRLEMKFKNKAEKLINSPLTLAIVGGLILLAFAVNLIEFFCSAGLPATFTRILTLNALSPLSYYFYLVLYTFVFMLDDLIVFSIALITLRKISFTDKYNRWSTLIGGLLMLVLGILLIFKPEFLMFA